MKYTHEERIEIGRDVYTSGMSCHDAMAKYNLSHGKLFWSDGYFACSIGEVSSATIQKYIESQG